MRPSGSVPGRLCSVCRAGQIRAGRLLAR